MQKFTFDRQKDKIQIIAPASKCKDLDAALTMSENLFKKHGFKFSVSEELFNKNSMNFYSNTLDYRYEDLKKALDDEDIKILWCVRGGYGSAEIGNLLWNYELKSPKLLIGFSDITSLHLLFNHKFHIPSIHGEMLSGPLTENKAKNLELVFDLLKGNNLSYKLQKLNHISYNKIEDTSITGGNLTVLCSNIGGMLRSEFFDDKILFLEDIDEQSYKIMRSLMQLFHGGFLSKLKAIIFGQFTKSDKFKEETLQYFIDKYCNNIPIFALDSVGHGEINEPIIFGNSVIIQDDIVNYLV
jgi:muramoyltetrapeptide carboxypeptidase